MEKGLAVRSWNRSVPKADYTGTQNGFGMNNIRERLALYFGTEGRFEIESVEDEWTCVTIDIPVCKESPEIKKGDGA